MRALKSHTIKALRVQCVWDLSPSGIISQSITGSEEQFVEDLVTYCLRAVFPLVAEGDIRSKEKENNESIGFKSTAQTFMLQ